jgi:hypothetical protein
MTAKAMTTTVNSNNTSNNNNNSHSVDDDSDNNNMSNDDGDNDNSSSSDGKGSFSPTINDELVHKAHTIQNRRGPCSWTIIMETWRFHSFFGTIWIHMHVWWWIKVMLDL